MYILLTLKMPNIIWMVNIFLLGRELTDVFAEENRKKSLEMRARERVRWVELGHLLTSKATMHCMSTSQVRDEIEQLMDDDGDMAEMYLTEKKNRMESASFYGDQSMSGYRSNDVALSVSAPVTPASSPPDVRRLEKSLSLARSRHESSRSSESAKESIEELEMLLEAYFVVIDSTLNKLTSLKEYIDDTEDFINIQLDNVRNQLIQFELLLTTATFVVAIFGVVAGIFVCCSSELCNSR